MKIVISPGEPAGIGPDIIIQALQPAIIQQPLSNFLIVGDPDLFEQRAQLLKLPLPNIEFIKVKLPADCNPGTLNVNNAAYVLECLSIAADYCLQKKASALVTGPIQKSILNDAGIPFSGHTEYLQEKSKVKQVLMLFVTETMKVALVTTHLPLKNVSSAITIDKINDTVRLLETECKKLFRMDSPKILVCGLNPHAGENGHLGREEIDTIIPAIKMLKAEGINVDGPLPADTIFTDKYLKSSNIILAMYHDQALPVVKYASFGKAVNLTLGLPFIRTSVDHGTALDVAGTGLADPKSFEAAIELALKLI